MATANPKSRWGRVLLVGAGLLVAVGAGCLHHMDMAPCTRAAAETACWESTRSDARGRLRHVVVERVRAGDRCDTVRVEQTSFDEQGNVSERVVDDRHCGVVDRRVVDRYDVDTGQLVRSISTDANHDDQFDRVVTRRTRLSEAQRAYAREAQYRTLHVHDDARSR
jgi:hypothetical protein